MVCDTLYLQNELGDPPIFQVYIFDINLSLSNYSQSLNEMCAWEDFGRERV